MTDLRDIGVSSSRASLQRLSAGPGPADVLVEGSLLMVLTLGFRAYGFRVWALRVYCILDVSKSASNCAT